MTSPATLRAIADQETGHLPALLARAHDLASTVLLGEHGRRRAGMGDDFWQYRPMQPGDSRRMIDWRRSARGDAQFVREREWQIAQSVQIWVNSAASMRFASHSELPTKSDRARVLAMALAVLLNRGGERVGLANAHLPPERGAAQLERIAGALSNDTDADYHAPDADTLIPHSVAVFVSDFLDDSGATESALAEAADKGVRGILLQALDPAEENFPYRGRAIFESVGKTLRHDTLKADALRNRYLDRLSARKDALTHLARTTGWQYHLHHTDQGAQSALLWLYSALDGRF